MKKLGNKNRRCRFIARGFVYCAIIVAFVPGCRRDASRVESCEERPDRVIECVFDRANAKKDGSIVIGFTFTNLTTRDVLIGEGTPVIDWVYTSPTRGHLAANYVPDELALDSFTLLTPNPPESKVSVEYKIPPKFVKEIIEVQATSDANASFEVSFSLPILDYCEKEKRFEKREARFKFIIDLDKGRFSSESGRRVSGSSGP